MKSIYIVALEPIEQRYTQQWYNAIPNEIAQELAFQNKHASIITVAGSDIGESRTSGAFLDFALTNVWKNSQLNKICDWFSRGVIKSGDIFLVTDAWHPGIIQIKYMSELLGIPVVIMGIWHAGSYDKTDILGFTIKDKNWSHNFERSIYHALDYNFYGSNYHKDLFCRILNVDGSKAHHSGQPHCEILKNATEIEWSKKEDNIIFGHRISPDKQPEIFEDLSKELPQYNFIFTQKLNLSKPDYYDLLRKSKLSFSANLHENFGISMVESIFNGTPVLVPDRLSYSEMYDSIFKYPSEWTSSFDSYMINKKNIVGKINYMMSNDLSKVVKNQQDMLKVDYMTAKTMTKRIVNLI